MKAVKKDVFDINKVTVVGSPTITSDGVASGLDMKNNYIITPFTTSKPFFVEYIFNTGNFDTTADTKFLVKFVGIGSIYSNKNANSFTISYNSNDGTIKYAYLGEAIKNTNYKLSCNFNGANSYYKMQNLDTNEEFLTNLPLLTENFNLTAIKHICFELGSIDLTAFKIYVDGELVYSPTRPTTFLERRKEGFDLSKFTVVGSPTITEDGVLDGSTTDSSNYLTIPYDITNAKSVRVEFEATSIVLDDDTSHAGALFGVSSLPFYLYVSASGKSKNAGIDMWIANSSGSALLRHSYNLTPTGSKVKFVWELKDGVWTISFETSAGYTMSKSAPAEEITNIKTSGIISISKGRQWWLTNLPSISITVDGKEVFTGAKEKFYAIGD